MVVWQVDDDGGGLSVGRRERERGGDYCKGVIVL